MISCYNDNAIAMGVHEPGQDGNVAAISVSSMCDGFLIEEVYVMGEHETYMRKAIKEALKAKEKSEVPVGAVIVKDGKVIARAFNMREIASDATAHAEVLAIRKACKKLQSWRLDGCTIYVTLEPCSMCSGALILSRIERIVFGAYDPKGGALGTSYDILAQKGINHWPEVIGGVLEEESGGLLKEFFKERRGKKSMD